MTELIERIRQSIRLYKNNLIGQYFQQRIYRNLNPYQVLFRQKPYKILFILSHMRSGSSLLSHILVSNPEIIGFGESHIQYSSEWDFKRLMMRVYYQAQEFSKIPEDLANLSMNHTYVLDKVLHNEKFLRDDFLTSKQIQIIFLLREPTRTMPSLLDLKPHWNQDDALAYYVERLLALQHYAQLINDRQRTLLITYNQILEDTPIVLAYFHKFLQTKVGFSEEYQILNTTGKRYIGDYKGQIKAGRIVRNQRKLNIQVGQEVIEKANYYYNQSLSKLSAYCQNIKF
jgi:hypothetical protein